MRKIIIDASQVVYYLESLKHNHVEDLFKLMQLIAQDGKMLRPPFADMQFKFVHPEFDKDLKCNGQWLVDVWSRRSDKDSFEFQVKPNVNLPMADMVYSLEKGFKLENDLSDRVRKADPILFRAQMHDLEMDMFGKVLPDDDKYNPYHTRFLYAIKMLAPVIYALFFINCKNTKIENDLARPKNVYAPKESKKNKGPIYKVLKIDGMTKVLNTEGDAQHNGPAKAFHICRGHFATYTEEKPLFGKVVGTFWVPAHTKGSKKFGEVIKDYELKRKDLNATPTV